jgi:hypothetical protein
MNDDLDMIRKRIEAMCEEFPNVEMILLARGLILENGTIPMAISGNFCIVCAKSILHDYIIVNNVQHIEVINQKEKRH